MNGIRAIACHATAQSQYRWQGFAHCMVLFVSVPTTKTLSATQTSYFSDKRLPILHSDKSLTNL